MSQSIAFIGVGNMGCPMAENLMKSGKSVKVFLYSDIRRPETSYCQYDLIYCCHDYSALDYKIFQRLGIPYIIRKLNIESNVLDKKFNEDRASVYVKSPEFQNDKPDKTIQHYQFLNWPDHGAPEDPKYFVDFVDYIRNNKKKNTKTWLF